MWALKYILKYWLLTFLKVSHLDVLFLCLLAFETIVTKCVVYPDLRTLLEGGTSVLDERDHGREEFSTGELPIGLEICF